MVHLTLFNSVWTDALENLEWYLLLSKENVVTRQQEAGSEDGGKKVDISSLHLSAPPLCFIFLLHLSLLLCVLLGCFSPLTRSTAPLSHPLSPPLFLFHLWTSWSGSELLFQGALTIWHSWSYTLGKDYGRISLVSRGRTTGEPPGIMR